jgi:hypothetical protein
MGCDWLTGSSTLGFEAKGILLMRAVDPYSSDVVHACRNLLGLAALVGRRPVDNYLHTAQHPLKLGQDLVLFQQSERVHVQSAEDPPDKRRQWMRPLTNTLHAPLRGS